MLRDLWRRSASLPPEAVAALRELDALARSHPELMSPAHALAAVLAAVFSIEDARRDVDEVLQGVSDSLAGGRHAGPILVTLLDREAVRRRGLAACDELLAQYPDASRLREALRTDRERLARWGEWLLQDRGDDFVSDVATLGLNGSLALAVLRLSLLPGLSRIARILNSLSAVATWDRGTCPLCGDVPCLSESRGLEGARVLRCGTCAAEWRTPRLGCAGCGEQDARKLRSISAEGEELRRRLVRCETCGLGLLVISTLAPLTPPELLVAELGAAHLVEP